jgi:hypothetical protein
MRFFAAAHWLIPWLIAIIGLYALVRFTRGYLDEKPFTDLDRRLVILYGRLLEVQGLAGLIYFFWSGFTKDGFPAYRIWHSLVMFIVALIPVLARRWEGDGQNNMHLHYFAYFMASLLLMVFGVALIPS